MTRGRSIGRLLLVGATAFAVVAGSVMIGIILLFGSLRRGVERDTSARLAEQHAADEIVTAVYGQLLASYQQLQSPSQRNMERFDSLGQTAYIRLRQYLFQSMSIAARFQVETIKELHQTLEVEAHGAFELIKRGEVVAARARVAQMQRRAERLEEEVVRFAALRDQERARLREEQVTMYQRLLIGITVIGALLIVYAILFVRLVHRHVVLPLGQLAEAAVRLGSGDLSTRIPKQRHDELETVARRFNDMADSIRDTRTELEYRNVELNKSIVDLKKTQQDLVQQEKLGAIGLMLAGLAHELNNPLAGILGSAECIGEELESSPDPAIRRVISELVTPLISEAGRAGDLVRNLLQFSRQSNAQLEAVSLKTAIDVSAGLRAYAFAQAGKDLLLDIPDTLFVMVDVQRLEHVMMNIMSNALDAMRAGSGTRLTVRARASGSEWVSLTFEDDGPGFLEPDRVFDAFYTTKPVGTGTGLGLSLVQRFIAEAGGTITAENAESGGARLTIRLHAAPAPPRTAAGPIDEPSASEVQPGWKYPPAEQTAMAQAAETPAHNATGQRRILVVDDEPAIREIQRRFLAKAGLEVLIAKDGAEAVTILKRERLDAVITDIRMPGEFDGIALYHWIVLHQPGLAQRCLFVTGDLEPGNAAAILATHPEKVISKPFRRDAYIDRVLGILEEIEAPA